MSLSLAPQPCITHLLIVTQFGLALEIIPNSERH
jgi:hypothetical protein